MISPSFSRQSWFCFAAAKRTSLCILLCLSSGISAVPLQNWRLPFYRIAAERGEAQSSPSGLFWDDFTTLGCFDSSLAPDSAAFASNHFTLEPSVGLQLSNEPFLSQERYNLQGCLLSDFRYKRFSIRNVLDVDRQYAHDPVYYWHKGRGAAGRIEEAYVQYHGPYGFARLGRLNRQWGPFPDRSILLSDNPFSYDAFEWQLHVPFLEFRHLFAAFPRQFSWQDIGGNNRRINRYFTAHSLNFRFGSWASAGVSETVVFSRESGLPDFQYVNPFSVYSVINTNYEGVGNLMLGFQGWVHPFVKSITLKGQVVLDDFQVDEGDGNEEPTHWALDMGAYWVDPLPIRLPHHARLEYTYLSKWLYTVSNPNTDNRAERYTYLQKSLGYPWIDGDKFSAALTACGKNYWAASVGFELTRRDTNTLQTRWPEERDNYGDVGYTDETPLSKRSTVQTTISPFLELHGYLRDFCAVHAGIEPQWIRNKNHTGASGMEFDPRLHISVTCHYSDFFLRF